jgi:hypothetical protein
MISKSMRMLARNKMASRGLINTQARAMGGGEKKPPMASDERNFDVVFVGKFILFHFFLFFSLIIFHHFELVIYVF